MSSALDNAVDVVGISKRFHFPSSAKQATLKDLVLQRVRVEGRKGVVDALDDVTFSVGRGQTLGVIGENGSGKTTLLRILAGITKPDRGEVRLRGHVAPMLALGTGFNPYLTGRENALIELLMLGLSREQAARELASVIEFSELGPFIDAPMRTYSTGMTMRLAFAAAIRVDPDILLIDEVLSVGDERFGAKCTAWLRDFKAQGKTTILVTHEASTVSAECDVALWLDRGRVAAYGERIGVVRRYIAATTGAPVAQTLEAGSDAEADRLLAKLCLDRIAGIMPRLRLPLVGFVRQTGTLKGGYEDGWTNGALEFTFEAIRPVRGWTVRMTVPAGMPEDQRATLSVDDRSIASVPTTVGHIELRCEVPVEPGRSVRVRVETSKTVNLQALGISGDMRDVGVRIDEIFFEHSGGA